MNIYKLMLDKGFSKIDYMHDLNPVWYSLTIKESAKVSKLMKKLEPIEYGWIHGEVPEETEFTIEITEDLKYMQYTFTHVTGFFNDFEGDIDKFVECVQDNLPDVVQARSLA